MKPIEVECPYCNAPAGEWCVSKGGKQRVYYHAAREADAMTYADSRTPAQVFDDLLEEASGHSDYDLDLPVPENFCGDHGEFEPTCDICGRGQCSTPELEWDGEMGNHVQCQYAPEDPNGPQSLAEVMGTDKFVGTPTLDDWTTGHGIVMVRYAPESEPKPGFWLRIKKFLGFTAE